MGNYSIFLGRVAVAEAERQRYGYWVWDTKTSWSEKADPWKTVPAGHVGSFDYPLPNDSNKTKIKTKTTLSLSFLFFSLLAPIPPHILLYIETTQCQILHKVTNSATHRNTTHLLLSYTLYPHSLPDCMIQSSILDWFLSPITHPLGAHLFIIINYNSHILLLLNYIYPSICINDNVDCRCWLVFRHLISSQSYQTTPPFSFLPPTPYHSALSSKPPLPPLHFFF